MAHAVWGGALTFGLVSVPVQLVAAVESHTIRFHQVQRGTGDRVRHKRVNERTGEEVPFADVVKGYPTEAGWVIVEPKELEDIAPGRSRSLEIIGFVDLAQVDPVYLGGTYYLAPDGAEYRKVYALLREALETTNRAGIATFVMRNRQYLAALKAEKHVLALHVLHWADEVRDPHRELGASLPDRSGATAQELGTAVQLIEAMAIDWQPLDYKDTYQETVRALIDAKQAHETVEKAVPAPRSTALADLMDALQASVEARRSRTD
ncbi:DNA end-binding protein Ku [Saccharopolyspora shandongensis]|uniref:Non-homologous end joining protein Ku n=2 Tax=Saccharopolyspora shandongensis TaxID=418495 RepID=A0A1H3TMY7_9PSEU|nr:DNA end-binding protein Ku [Saccharopolyspora shandongensis]